MHFQTRQNFHNTLLVQGDTVQLSNPKVVKKTPFCPTDSETPKNCSMRFGTVFLSRCLINTIGFNGNEIFVLISLLNMNSFACFLFVWPSVSITTETALPGTSKVFPTEFKIKDTVEAE